VGFEGELFAGRPDFDALLGRGANALSTREQAFLDGEVRTLNAMLDEFEIDEARDLPPEVWQFLRERRFFGMIIPEEHGGLGFGHHAHATVVARIASVNVAAAVTVMVPNSLGPADLLLSDGTAEQKAHYLPRLADGRELPCFALTSPYAGSDAASIPEGTTPTAARGARGHADSTGARHACAAGPAPQHAVPPAARRLARHRAARRHPPAGAGPRAATGPTAGAGSVPGCRCAQVGGLKDLIQALELSRPLAGELEALNKVLRRTRSLEQAAGAAADPAAALAYLHAADRVIQVDDFE
jgi:hypothetical protein